MQKRPIFEEWTKKRTVSYLNKKKKKLVGKH